MMNYETIAVKREGSVAFLNLDRPEARNAMNRQMVADLRHFFDGIREDRSIRAVALGGNGKAFCAGGDIKEMRAEIAAPREEQLQQARLFDGMLTAVNQAPQVVIARMHGAVLGGGVGLMCVADIAVATADAHIGLPEVRLGLAPAIISPYVVARVGMGRARQLMLTGASLTGVEAVEIGLASTAVPPDQLDAHITDLLNQVLQASPDALAACKSLLFNIQGKTVAETVADRVDLLSRLRAGSEGQEGMLAFIQKRPPRWVEAVERKT